MSQAIAEAQREPDTTYSPSSATSRRLWEVDAWRGLAISMMILYHLLWDLKAFVGLNIVLGAGFWGYFQKFIAISFVTLVGISLVISYNRAIATRESTEGLYWKFFRRGLTIFGIGMVITVVVRAGGVGRIDYGILHMIGTAIILAYPFLNLRWTNLVLAAGLWSVATYLKTFTAPPQVYHWVWLGIDPPNYYALDYFPLPRWFPVVLIGIFIGNTFYRGGHRQFSLPDFSPFFPINVLRFLGQHSLLIYTVHQPILIALLYITGVIRF